LKHSAAFKGLFVTNGKVQMEFQVMLGLAQANLPELEFNVLEKTAEKCVVEGRRSPRHRMQQAEFTAKDAFRAGLLDKEAYRKYPGDMFYAKAGERLMRIIAADVLLGICYDKDEMEEIGKVAPGGGMSEQLEPPIQDAEIVESTNDSETGEATK
jgi:hypothetical protein